MKKSKKSATGMPKNITLKCHVARKSTKKGGKKRKSRKSKK